MGKERNTKKLILEKALDLFSQKGFQAVSTREIAEALGLQKGALYNHFKNKQDIFDSILILVEDHIKQMNPSYASMMIEKSSSLSLEHLSSLSKDDLIELSCRMFECYLTDDIIMKFRRMYMIEQYSNEDARIKYQTIFIDSMIDRVTVMNQQLMDAGVYKKSDPRKLAVWYFAPSFLLMNRYDGADYDISEITSLLRGCLEHFMNEVYLEK